MRQRVRFSSLARPGAVWCWAPSISIASLAEGQEPSSTKRVMGCCLRKRNPSSCWPRRHGHRQCSASVMCGRRSRAAYRRAGGTGVGAHAFFSPLLASPRWGEGSETAFSKTLMAFLIGDNVYFLGQGKGLATVGFGLLGPRGSRYALRMIRRPSLPLGDVSLAPGSHWLPARGA